MVGYIGLAMTLGAERCACWLSRRASRPVAVDGRMEEARMTNSQPEASVVA